MSVVVKLSCIRNIIFFTLIIVMVSCVLSKNNHEKNNYQHATPPNGIKIGDGIYYDKTELRNIDWTEYVTWTANVFGPKSVEYAATIPDDSVWIRQDSCLGIYLRNYRTHPAFEEYPVVGISQKQAEQYSKWRTDRVFEYILYSNNKIKYDARQSSKTHFTIEKYFSGKYKNHYPDTAFKYYLEYRLPNRSEWEQALSYADSVEKAYLEKCKSPSCKVYKLMWPDFQSDITPCKADTLFMIPTRKARNGFVPEKRNPVYNLRGNVSEWITEPGISKGGGWVHNRNEILSQDTFHVRKPNCWTGFRNVCEWKEANK